MHCRAWVLPFTVSFACVLSAQGTRTGQPSLPARDTPAQPSALATPSGTIAGRVLAADNGRPVKRARAYVSAPELPEGRGALTDDSGAFELTGLPAGRYTLTVSKAGFVSLSYGQRRPLQAGTPLQLGDGQQMSGIEFRLPRGSVIAGHVYDEAGDPTPGTTVRVMRYQYADGSRQIVPAGTTQTDDQGAYRIWGLNPGNYYVSAVQRNVNAGPAGRNVTGRGGFDGGARGGRGASPDAASDDPAQLAYAPTYYPGVGSINEAASIVVGVGQQSLDINFNLLLVRAARVTGTVANADGSPATNGLVNLSPEGGGAAGRGQSGLELGSRIEWNGRYTIASVPPGRYTLRARSDDGQTPRFAAQPLTAAQTDLTAVTVVVYPGATISGMVTFEGADAPNVRQVRIMAPSAETIELGPTPNARIDNDGQFTLGGVPAGSHWIRSAGIRGWSMKSVIVDGRDVADVPIELRSGQKLDNVTVVFSSRQTEINGTVTNEQSLPVTDFTVLAFPTDPSMWRPLARQIMTARPDQNGRYQMRGLPPGNYYVATVDPAEQGEWFEPAFLEQQRLGAARLSLGDGDVKTNDFRISTR